MFHPPTLADVVDLVGLTVNELYKNQSYDVWTNYEQNAVNVYDPKSGGLVAILPYDTIISHRRSAHDFVVYLKSKVKEKL